MRPLFVSFVGHIGGQSAQGWVVLEDYPPLSNPENMKTLVDKLELLRRYDAGTLVLANFQRLEAP